MSDNNKKTFSDLFSSSEENMKSPAKEVNNESFGVTFDSLFEKTNESNKMTPNIPNKDNNDSNQSLNDLLVGSSNIIKNSNIEKEAVLPNEELTSKTESSKDTISLTNIFESIKEKNEEEQKKETKPIEDINPFFQEEPTNSEESINSEEPKEETKPTEDINPFFQEEPTNSKGTINSEEPKEEPKPTEDINPFFQEESTNSKESINFEEPKEETKPIENINPFFQEESDTAKETSTIETSLVSENLITKDAEKNKIMDQKESETTKAALVSENPFFSEQKEEEVNPLFLNTLNLIENEKDGKKTGNLEINATQHFDVKVVKKKEPLLKFILGVISYSIFILLLLIGIALLVYVLDIKIRAAKGDTSSPTFNAYVVLTGSMLPEIEVYDVVVTKKVEAKELKENDIITFSSADSRFLGTIITHRIIKKNYDSKTKSYTFQTKGDNNNVADSALVPQGNIYGKVILKIPKLGYLQEFLASDGGWIIVILIPCLTVISYDIVKLAKGLKRKKNLKVQK